MIFETLYEASCKGELILVDGGLLRFHIRRDGQATIHEIIVTQPGCGVGKALLNRLRGIARQQAAVCIVAKCPSDLSANGWYEAQGFCKTGEQKSPSGRRIYIWRLPL